MSNHTFRIVLDCPDQVGIVTRVGEVITNNSGWITEAAHHSDEDSNWFFSRIEVKADSLPFGAKELKSKLEGLRDELSLNLEVLDTAQPKRVVLMASKGSHCLSDLLDRWKSGDIECDIPCVISNHDDMRSLVEWYGIPFFHVPIKADNKQAGFDEVERLIMEHEADCVVLARYMQIIPETLCQKLKHKVINIHHSFLPSFIGAKPYHQAARRGVKLIGATCHYVTEELDEGPIIDQDVTHVSHRETIEDLVRRGKDVEKTVLARGLRSHLEDRVLVHGNKTIVFN